MGKPGSERANLSQVLAQIQLPGPSAGLTDEGALMGLGLAGGGLEVTVASNALSLGSEKQTLIAWWSNSGGGCFLNEI